MDTNKCLGYTSHQVLPENPIIVRIEYVKQEHLKSHPNQDIPQKKRPLIVHSFEFSITVEKQTLLQSPYFQSKFNGPWNGAKTVTLQVTTEKLALAYMSVLKLLQVMALPGPSVPTNPSVMSYSMEQASHFIRCPHGIEIEMCIASNRLLLKEIQRRCENSLMSVIRIPTFVQTTVYAASFGSKRILAGCYEFLKQNLSSVVWKGRTKSIDDSNNDDDITNDDDDMGKNKNVAQKNYLEYDGMKNVLLYNDYSMYLDVFDLLRVEDLVLRNQYLSPGYSSSGGKSCEIDMKCRSKTAKFCGFPGTVRCYVERTKKLGRQENISRFSLFREDTHQFVLSGYILPGSQNAIFVNSRDVDVDNLSKYRYSSCFVGYMEGNFVRSEFMLYDNGIEWDADSRPIVSHSRSPVCGIKYGQNVLRRNPYSMKVQLPPINSILDEAILDDLCECGDESLTYALEHSKSYGKTIKRQRKSESKSSKTKGGSSSSSKSVSSTLRVLYNEPVVLITKEALWSSDLGGWTLTFEGRSKKSSKKNFQLQFSTDSQSNGPVILCFGKVLSSRFSLDYACPLSSLQALSIAMSVFMKRKITLF